jgi:hypothetical protein
MTTPLPTILICSICHKPVAVETCKTDEHGHPIHEECYVLKVKLFQASQPSRKSTATHSLAHQRKG